MEEQVLAYRVEEEVIFNTQENGSYTICRHSSPLSEDKFHTTHSY